MMSLEAGTKRETADRIEANTAPLREVVSILKEVCEAAVFNEKKAQLDAAASIQDYKASKIIQHGTEAANRALGSRSQKNADAMMATQIIHEKYAGSIGRLQSFRELARSAMTSIQMDRGVYHQEALERLRAESRLITGSSAKPVVLDAVPAGQVGEVSFYKVPVSAKPSRK
jgi:hypothetical protein